MKIKPNFLLPTSYFLLFWVQLLSHSRAVSEKMDDEVNPVAKNVTDVSYLPQIEGVRQEKAIECLQDDKPALMANNEGVTSEDNSSCFQAVSDESTEGINAVGSSLPAVRIEPVTNSTPPKDVPRNEDGSAENPGAYRLWQPEKLEGEQINPTQLREKLASLSQRFALPKPKKEIQQPKNEIEELNRWLADPILRNEAMRRILNSDCYNVEFDEEGRPIRAINQSD